MMRHAAIVLFVLLALGCSATSPASDEARAFFQQRYPYAELIDVKVAKDEDAARSVVFRYRISGRDQTSEVAIQFVKDPATGLWSPQPEEPRALP
jgi:hypothetical protein